MAARRSARASGRIFVFALVLALVCIGLVGLASAQVPAGAGAGVATGQRADVLFVDRGGRSITRTVIIATRVADAGAYVPHLAPPRATSHVTLYLVRYHCLRRPGGGVACGDIRARAFELDATSFEFDPLLGSARVRDEESRTHLRWTATGDYETELQRVLRRRGRTDDRNLWWTASVNVFSSLSRPASIEGRILGHRVGGHRASLGVWTGSSEHTSGCVLDRGEICD
jgi:hypothetical protein